MNPITIIEGVELRDLIADLNSGRVYRLRIHQDSDGVKVKINEGTWTYWIGQADK